METTKLPPSSPSSPTTSFSVPSAEKVDGFPRRSMRRARQRRSHSSSQFRYQSSQVELTPLPLLKVTLQLSVEPENRLLSQSSSPAVMLSPGATDTSQASWSRVLCCRWQAKQTKVTFLPNI
ncbi:hypothetical protein PAMA_013992 [Pampus argenteus]